MTVAGPDDTGTRRLCGEQPELPCGRKVRLVDPPAVAGHTNSKLEALPGIRATRVAGP